MGAADRAVVGRPAQGYAGDLTPDEAWRLLSGDRDAALIDVRTAPEWAFVGVPDLAGLGRQAAFVSWQVFPDMNVNPDFAAEIVDAVPGKGAPVLFLCRSGGRSKAAAIAMTERGYTRCYNVLEGFEGVLDGAAHRGTTGGWKVRGLPWKQS
jgi:rhodanese-related sulfurtransferase